jgi:hypothetical protein
MTLRHRLLAALIMTGIPVGGAGTATAVVRAVDVPVTAAPFDVAAGTSLEVTVDITNLVATGWGPFDPASLVDISLGPRVVSRDAAQTLIDNGLRASGRTLDVERRPAGGLTYAGTTVTVSVPIGTQGQAGAAAQNDGLLSVAATGLHPVAIRFVRGDDVLGQIALFVNVIDDTSAADALPVTLVMSTTVDPVVDAAGNAQLTDAGIVELRQLVEALRATTIPATVSIPVVVLDALATADAALAAELAAALAPHELIAAPRWPLDPSIAAEASVTDRYVDWLTRGEDLARQFGSAPVRTTRSVHLVDAPLSLAGAGLLRDLGTRVLVMSPDHYDSTPGSLGGFADTSQLLSVDLGGTELDGAIIDRELATTLGETGEADDIEPIAMRADLLGLAAQIRRSGSSPANRMIVAGAVDEDGTIGVPVPARLAALNAAVTGTAGLRGDAVDELLSSTTRQLVAGDVATVSEPDLLLDARVSDIQARVESVQQVNQRIEPIVSMLPAGDPRPAAWSAQFALLASDAMPQDVADDVVATVDGELDAILGAVVLPTNVPLNLSDRQTDVRLRIGNTANVPLTVRVRLSANKLADRPDTVQVLPPQSVTDVLVPVEALSNGSFPVGVEVFTPSGDVLVGPPLVVTANVSVISGIGLFVSGAALLLLASWWFRHWQTSRRAKLALLDAAA